MTIDDIELTAGEMAKILAVTDRRVRQLADEGVVERGSKRGRYKLVPSVGRFCAANTVRADDGMGPIREQRLLKLRMENAMRERELITLDEAIGTTDVIVGMMVAGLNGLPARITQSTAERRRIEAIINDMRLRLVDRLAVEMERMKTGKAS